jgi:hypothetical protein
LCENSAKNCWPLFDHFWPIGHFFLAILHSLEKIWPKICKKVAIFEKVVKKWPAIFDDLTPRKPRKYELFEFWISACGQKPTFFYIKDIFLKNKLYKE